MALRYAFPITKDFVATEREVRRLPALREPTTIEYKGVPDIPDFLRQMQGVSYCKVKGPTGVGKSSVLPKLIASEMKKTVLVVSPHPMLAEQGYKFFKEQPAFKYDASHLRAEVGRPGVNLDIHQYDIIWMSATYLVAWLFSRRNSCANLKCMQDVVVFLDEAHESDAYTHIVRTVTPHMGISALLLVSATFEPSGHAVSTERVRVQTFDGVEKPCSWDIHDSGKPWSLDVIKNSALMYIDNKYDANRLKCDYEDAGYAAFHLHSRSLIGEYVEASDMLDDKEAPPTVLIVDSSFRSGFNFDVETIVDSGTRYLADGTIGVQAVFKRPIYNVEFVQAAGRGGRFGKKTTYYRPDIEPEWRICELEPVEAEAAAYLTRKLGFIPAHPVSKAVMATEELPKGVDIVEALNGDKPLTCYVRDPHGNPLVPSESGTVESVSTHVPDVSKRRENSVDSRHSKVSVSTKLTASSLRKLDESIASSSRTAGTRNASSYVRHGTTVRPCDSVSQIAPQPSVVSGVTPSVAGTSCGKSEADVWLELQSAVRLDSAAQIDPGAYLFCPDVDPSTLLERSRFFPDREKTLLQLSLGSDVAALTNGMSSKHVKFAIYHVVRRYNLLNMDLRAVKRALVGVVKDTPDLKLDSTVKRRFTSVISRLVAWELERDQMHKLAKALVGTRYTLSEAHDFQKAEDKRYDGFRHEFARKLEKHCKAEPKLEDWVGEHGAVSLRLKPGRLKPKLPRIQEAPEKTRVGDTIASLMWRGESVVSRTRPKH